MPSELPYLPTYKNVAKLFEKIHAAKRPESFTTRYLANTLGLKSTGDRSLISLLKTLGFLDGSGKPTPRYDALKNDQIAGKEIALGVREAYAPLFEANENAHRLNRDQLKGLVAQVAGTDAQGTNKIVGTFNALLGVADFSESTTAEEATDTSAVDEQQEPAQPPPQHAEPRLGQMNPQFHYNIQVHLPSDGSEETYLNIFNALRKVFK